ncbi:MAG: DNA polymerase III subunit gamma/tau, partial [Candidatus Hydrogenedentes bacterium]|nr:DNA polymerase III subunit gamma/tau [Candidatus Hydrogenedentota bacterium]
MADKGYLVLARKWRPQRFEDVVGQEHITRTLKNAITSGRIHHAFLFIGSRGIGKTTTARILAKALNCLSVDAPTPGPCGVCDNCRSIGTGTNIDVIEIDGASNNSVDDVREIRDNIRMVPSHGRYKVYIIDEVHQLSAAAFNALLKTLEEPPPHAIFILATTEAHKIPATIISRCQRYDFRRVSIDRIIELLHEILKAENIKASEEALHAIARSAEGGVRDAESILDELITYCDGEITFKDVFDVLGLVDWKVLHHLSEAILEKDIPAQLKIVEDVTAAGKDLGQFVQDILRYYRNLLVAKSANSADLLHLPEDERREVLQRANRYTLTELIRLVEQFATLTNTFDSQLAQRIALEALLIRLSKVGVEMSVDTVLEKLVQLGAGGVGLPARAPISPPNPPEAGPASAAPTAPAGTRRTTSPAESLTPPPPARDRRVAATPANLHRLWQHVLEHAGRDSLNHSIWLAQARPVNMEEHTLVIELPHGSDSAHSFLDKPENRAVLETALREVTTNLTHFRLHLANGPAETPGDPARPNTAQAYPGVSTEDL